MLCPVRHPVGHSGSPHCWNHTGTGLAMDDSDGPQSDRCRGWLSARLPIHDPQSILPIHRSVSRNPQMRGCGFHPTPCAISKPNAFAERFVKTIKDSCLDDRIFFGGTSLRKAASEFVSHYQTERNHQALNNKVIRPEFTLLPESGPIKCRSRLGGQLNDYYREVA